MQNRSCVLFAILLCLSASMSWGAETEVDETDLVPRMDILYKKFSTEAFTGFVVKYYDDGQMKTKSEYKDGLEVKVYEQYYENGQAEFTGTLKDGLRDGLWEFNYENGQLLRKVVYKKNEWEGLVETYRETGMITLRNN